MHTFFPVTLFTTGTFSSPVTFFQSMMEGSCLGFLLRAKKSEVSCSFISPLCSASHLLTCDISFFTVPRVKHQNKVRKSACKKQRKIFRAKIGLTSSEAVFFRALLQQAKESKLHLPWPRESMSWLWPRDQPSCSYRPALPRRQQRRLQPETLMLTFCRATKRSWDPQTKKSLPSCPRRPSEAQAMLPDLAEAEGNMCPANKSTHWSIKNKSFNCCGWMCSQFFPILTF